MSEQNCCIIINSCDAYEDVWDPMFFTLRDMWPDCPYEIYLNTETKTYTCNGLTVRSLHFDDFKCADKWGARLRKNLEHISSDYVVMLFDDFILERFVSQEKINEYLKILENNKDIAVIYLDNMQLPESIPDVQFPSLMKVAERADYRLNSSPAIWRRSKLLSYTGNNDTPWAWEFFGSARTYKTAKRGERFLYDPQDCYYYNYRLGGAIHRGMWVKSVIVPVIERYGLDIDCSRRGFEDESLQAFPHSLPWKVKFFFTGIKMVGLDALIFLFRSIAKRVVRKK